MTLPGYPVYTSWGAWQQCEACAAGDWGASPSHLKKTEPGVPMVKTTVVVKVASLLAAGACAAGMAGTAAAQDTKISLGMSGWTGFAPLSLADKAGIFKKNGLDVELKMIPQKDRHLAL